MTIKKKEQVKLIKGELAFLNSQAMKHLVREADFGACHEDAPMIENRKKKLKKLLKKLSRKWTTTRKNKYKGEEDKMVNGFWFGLGMFCFISMGFCLYLATKENTLGLDFLLAIIIGGVGILNMFFAFA